MARLPEMRSTRIISREGVLSCAVLLLLVWFGNFAEFDRFSLYADDWAYLGRSLSTPVGWTGWFYSIVPWSDGRPLQTGLIDLSGAVIHATGGLAAAYILLYGLTALSVLATWWALTYRFSNAVALLSAAIFAISPLVSVRPFLNGIASPAVGIFLPVAGVLYITGWRVAAYLVSALILLSYEMMFPLFIFLPPLLQPLRTRRDLYRLLGHVVICAAMVAAYAVFKDKFGGSRLGGAMAGRSAVDLGLGVVEAVLSSVRYGVTESLDLSLWLDRIQAASTAWAWGLVSFGAFLVLLQRLASAAPPAQAPDRRLTAQTLGMLVLMTFAGYGLVYFGSSAGAQEVLDRGSRFHSAANLPIGILTAMLLVAGLQSVRNPSLRRAVITVEAAYLAIMFAFSVAHEDDFAAEADRQRALVAQLVIDHPEMGPRDTFVIHFPWLDWQHRWAIEFEDGHSFHFLLRDLFDFSGGTGWRVGPVICIVHGDSLLQQVVAGADGRLAWNPATWPSEPMYPGRIWFYDFTPDGVLTARPAPIVLGGRNILHDATDGAEDAIPLAQLKRLPLFDVIMKREAPIVETALRSLSRPAASAAAGN